MNIFMKNIRGEKTTDIPVWFMRQAGRYLPEYRKIRSNFPKFMDLCKDVDAITEVTLQPINRFNLDAAIIFSDILVISESLKLKVDFIEGKGPLIDTIKNIKDFSILKDRLNYDNLNVVYKSIKAVKRELLNKKIPLIGFSGAPWTLATYLIEGSLTKDHNIIRSFAIDKTVNMDILINLLTDAISYHLINQIKAGADVVQIFDSHAGKADNLLQQKYCINPINKIISNVKKHYPNTPITVFSKGLNFNIINLVKNKDINCLSIDNNTNIELIKKFIPENTCIQGNLDPLRLVVGSDQMLLEAKNIIDTMKNNPFIFNLGHGILPNTPVDNVNKLVDEIRKTN